MKAFIIDDSIIETEKYRSEHYKCKWECDYHIKSMIKYTKSRKLRFTSNLFIVLQWCKLSWLNDCIITFA